MSTNNSDGFLSTPEQIHVYQCFCERQIIAAILGVTAITGVFGNTLILLSVALSRKLRTTTNVFVVNLGIADLLTCLVLPLNIVAILSDDGYILPDHVCIFNAIMTIICIGASVNSLTCIATNRLLLITKSRAVYQKVYTQIHIVLILTLVWTFPAIIALIPVVSSFAQLGYDERYSTCLWISTAGDSDSYMYSILVALCFYPVQLTITFYSYTMVFLHVRRSSRALADSSTIPTISNLTSRTPSTDVSCKISTFNNQQNARGTGSSSGSNSSCVVVNSKMSPRKVAVTKNLFYVLCTYILCLTPYTLCIIISNTEELVPYVAAILCLNSCLNPIIYATKHPDFKKTFRGILCCRVADIPDPIAAVRSIHSG